MGSSLTIDNVPGPVFEGEDQQFWISDAEATNCQMWNVRPDPMLPWISDAEATNCQMWDVRPDPMLLLMLL